MWEAEQMFHFPDKMSSANPCSLIEELSFLHFHKVKETLVYWWKGVNGYFFFSNKYFII